MIIVKRKKIGSRGVKYHNDQGMNFFFFFGKQNRIIFFSKSTIHYFGDHWHIYLVGR